MPKYQVRVESLPDKVVPLVKSLRLVADLGLKDAKDLSDHLASAVPSLLVAGIDHDVAQHVSELLIKAGASARVEESSIDEPMMLCPGANHRYRWSWLSGPTPLDSER